MPLLQHHCHCSQPEQLQQQLLPGPAPQDMLLVVFEGFEHAGALWLPANSPRLWRGCLPWQQQQQQQPLGKNTQHSTWQLLEAVRAELSNSDSRSITCPNKTVGSGE